MLNIGIKSTIEPSDIGRCTTCDSVEFNVEKFNKLWNAEVELKGIDRANVNSIFFKFVGYTKLFALGFLYAVYIG